MNTGVAGGVAVGCGVAVEVESANVGVALELRAGSRVGSAEGLAVGSGVGDTISVGNGVGFSGVTVIVAVADRVGSKVGKVAAGGAFTRSEILESFCGVQTVRILTTTNDIATNLTALVI